LIDARAIIDPSVVIGRDVSIGPWTTIGPGVEIGDGCRIASHVVLKGPTRLGRDNRIFQFATIGEDTPALVYRGEPTRLEIGDRNTFREGVTVHRGTVQARGKTVIGNDNLFMAYVHVGHDCIVGNHVIMANNSSVSGHVTVGDHANFGGYSGVPQYRSVGAYSHIAGMSLVLKDVPAYVTVAGNPAGVVGLNLEGMKRRNLAREAVDALREAYRIVYRSGLVVKDALAELASLSEVHPEVAMFAADVANSRWGIIRPRGEPAAG
jgi:UDP-N-acetylglucosamine acyltransferase